MVFEHEAPVATSVIVVLEGDAPIGNLWWNEMECDGADRRTVTRGRNFDVRSVVVDVRTGCVCGECEEWGGRKGRKWWLWARRRRKIRLGI